MTSAGNHAFNSCAPDTELQSLSTVWSSGLEEMAAELKVVAGTTEDEFLVIGGRLQDFYQRGVGISSLASQMVSEVAGEQVSGAMSALGKMVDDMGRYVDSAQQEIGRSSETLQEILGLLDQVAVPLSGFKKVNKVLRVLGISTKIESSRLGQGAAGFDTLASDVGNLATQVSEKASLILSRKDELAKSIEHTLTGVLNSGVQQHRQVTGMLDKTRVSLGALTDVNSRCATAVAGISAVSEEVSRNVGEVVMSMQAHDMVRQQIEHVDETLSELQQRLALGAAGADETACICELQTAQLQNAAAELEAAVQAIVGNLREVAKKQSALSQETGSISGIADQAGGSFFSEMQRDISVITAALLESSKVTRSLGLAMVAVSGTVGEIVAFVGDIEKIGEEIKLIALNAQIKSAFTGEEGAALGVLAEAIQRLSIEAIDHTAAVSGTLQDILAVKERLSAWGNAESSDLETEVTDMVANLGALLDVLRAVTGALQRSLTGMDDAVTLLSSEIDQVTTGFTVHHKISRVLEGAVRGLGDIVAQARKLAPASEQGASLHGLAGRYTMQSERRIHESLLKGAAAHHAAPSSVDDGFDDNVELF